MASELTEGFAKSRNRLIYFSGIGVLLSFFPIDPESSLFGIKFMNLESESVSLIFLIITTGVFLDFLVRLVEEAPALKGGHANVMERTDQYRFYLSQITDSLNEVKNKFREYSGKHSTEIAKELIATSDKIESWANRAKSEYRPGKITSFFGQLRIWLEFFSGLIIFVIYVILSLL
jgi:hypothetical protein